MSPKLITEYTGEITYEKNGKACIARLQGTDPQIVQEMISNIFQNKGHLEDTQVFSQAHFDGQLPVGWVGTVEVPAAHSTKALVENRLTLLNKVRAA